MLVLKIAAGIILAFVLLVAGCSALVAGSSDDLGSPNVETVSLSDVADMDSDESSGQKNARHSAESYLSHSAFSRKGLIKQLTSEYGEGYSMADAIYAVDHVDVDWNEQAVKAAKNYLSHSSFSRSGLIKQLESEYGEGFTHAQAVYGVSAAY